MPDLKTQTPTQRRNFYYMAEVMRRLEWDLHNTIEATGRIPPEWHEIARAVPDAKREKVTLALDAEVLKFFRSMGPGYGPRIGQVLRSYMHARLAGVVRGAETVDHYRYRAEKVAKDKPQFGYTERGLEEMRRERAEREDRAAMTEHLQRRYAEEGLPWDFDGKVI